MTKILRSGNVQPRVFMRHSKLQMMKRISRNYEIVLSTIFLITIETFF